MFCDDPSTAFPLYTTLAHKDIGLIRVLIGSLYILMLLVTVTWVKSSERVAARELTPHTVNSVMFPIYTKILWLNVLCNAYIGVLLLVIPVSISDNNSDISRYLYPLSYSIQHFLIEGVAFMLMQKGCGLGAARKAFRYSFVWGMMTYFLMQLWYSTEHVVSIVFHVVWSGFMLVFFGCLWLLPQDVLYRRPAAIWYAKFWFWFRVVTLSFFILSESQLQILERIGRCSFTLGPLLFFPIIQPYLCYVALLEDSLWWKGLFLNDDKSPLAGFDISHDTAQALGAALDQVMSAKSVTLLNFAHITTSWSLLGQGSFSKVYEGKYKHVPCALKVIYNLDLTTTEVKKAIVEATILSSARHPNIVDIYGVCVNPPNLCMVIELCSLGSLSDVLRDSKLILSKADRLFLGLGCCEGLSALHALSDSIVHRDIKSMNFLVDSQLNAKLADLELGRDEAKEEIEVGTSANDFLLNWMPPEFMMNRTYTKASDVYALALVLWEIWSAEYPFSELESSEIKDKVLKGERPELAVIDDPAYVALLEDGWCQNPEERKSALDMRNDMLIQWENSSFPALSIDTTSTVFRSVMDGFMETPVGKKHISQLKCAETLESCRQSDRFTVGTSSMMLTSSMMSSPMHSLMLGKRESDVDENEIQKEIDELHRMMLKDPIFSSLVHITGDTAVVILSIREPHLIVNCTDSMEALVGISRKDLFGSSLSSLTSNVAESCFERNSAIYDFLRSVRCDMKHGRARGHAIVNIFHRTNNIVDSFQECSITSFPVYETVPDSEEEVVEEAEILRAHHSLSHRSYQNNIRFSDSGNRRNAIIYYGVVFTPLRSKKTINNYL